ncbi:MAG: hypothetical protein HKN82_09680 [Akkermansiaceae bacterium]|nr:hypothetical protein [Akkermansiaceae bacterium]
MKINLSADVRDQLEAPTLLAAWPGMGNVGATAMAYMRATLGAKPLGEIDMSEQVAPQAVTVENGLVTLPEVAVNALYYLADPPLLFMESPENLEGPPALELMSILLDFARSYEVSSIITGAAYALPVGHREKIRVLGAANQGPIRDRLVPAGVELMKDGQISGLNGLLLGFAGLRRIPAACLLATMPQYAVNIPNPKSSRAIIETLERLLEVKVDMAGLNEAVEKMDESMDHIEKQIRMALNEGEAAPEGGGESWKEVEEEEVPKKVMQHIEKLFDEVKSTGSREKATQLKAELDRWNLFKLYEDRFLNLFREED